MELIMKMNKKLLVLGATFALAAQFGTIAMAASVPGTATTLVLVPLSIVETTQMNFGTIAGGPLADEIVMNSAGTRTVTGTSASIIATGAGAATACLRMLRLRSLPPLLRDWTTTLFNPSRAR
jgi:hypothetical protein